MWQGVGAVCVSIWKSWELRAISHLTRYSNSHCLRSARMSGDWFVYVQLCISNEIWDSRWPSVLGNDFNNGDFEGKQYSTRQFEIYLKWPFIDVKCFISGENHKLDNWHLLNILPHISAWSYLSVNYEIYRSRFQSSSILSSYGFKNALLASV